MDTRNPLIHGLERLGEEHQRLLGIAIEEVTDIANAVSGRRIVDWYSENGTTSMTGISRVVNSLMLQDLKDAGWEAPWRYFRLKSQQATFEAGKAFDSAEASLRIGLDFGTRHKQSSLAYLVRPTVLALNSPLDENTQVAGIIVAFTEKTLDWGLWNKANSSFETLSAELELAAPIMSAPTCLIAVDPAPGLSVRKDLDYGGLHLELG
jgi:hypothetical protein